MKTTPRTALTEQEPGLDTVLPSGRLSTRVRASLRLEFQFNRSTGRTHLVSSHQEPPLRVVRAFEHDDGAALVHLHNVSGGLLSGDDLSLVAEVGPEARVQVTTAGATRIYRPRAGEGVARQSSEITVGEGALLEYVPDPMIPFAGARFSQRITIRLAPQAGLFWWEILAPEGKPRARSLSTKAWK